MKSSIIFTIRYEIIKIVINDAGNIDIDERTKISNKYINVSPTSR
jgi:hypothetical protein